MGIDFVNARPASPLLFGGLRMFEI